MRNGKARHIHRQTIRTKTHMTAQRSRQTQKQPHQHSLTARQHQHVHESKLTDRTKAMCTPRRRCEPEHSKQQKAPMGSDPSGAPGGGTISEAHRGCRSGQSEQTWFSGRFISTFKRFFSAFWSSPMALFHQRCAVRSVCGSLCLARAYR